MIIQLNNSLEILKILRMCVVPRRSGLHWWESRCHAFAEFENQMTKGSRFCDGTGTWQKFCAWHHFFPSPIGMFWESRLQPLGTRATKLLSQFLNLNPKVERMNVCLSLCHSHEKRGTRTCLVRPYNAALRPFHTHPTKCQDHFSSTVRTVSYLKDYPSSTDYVWAYCPLELDRITNQQNI